MKITLELFEDCCEFDGSLESGLNHLSWQLKIDGKDFLDIDSYENICKNLNILFDYEDLIHKTSPNP